MKYKVINKEKKILRCIDYVASEYISGHINMDKANDIFSEILYLDIEAKLKAIHNMKEEFDEQEN